MTIVVAFCSPARQHSAICADDLEFNTGAKTDKLVIVFERYALAITGSDFLKNAVEALRYFDARFANASSRGALPPIEDPRTLCAAVARITPRLSRWYMNRVRQCLKDERLTQADAERTIGQGGSLTILDMQSHTLDVAKMSCSAREADAGVPVSFALKRLQPDRAYQISDRAYDAGTVSPTAFENFREWAGREIRARAAVVNPQHPRPVFGDLGASVEENKGSWERWSVFEDYDTYLTDLGYPL